MKYIENNDKPVRFSAIMKALLAIALPCLLCYLLIAAYPALLNLSAYNLRLIIFVETWLIGTAALFYIIYK